MEVFIIGSWILWKERNDFVFNHRLKRGETGGNYLSP
jgi:hypothetical protein